jgi:hypothetical protein
MRTAPQRQAPDSGDTVLTVYISAIGPNAVFQARVDQLAGYHLPRERRKDVCLSVSVESATPPSSCVNAK